MSPINYLDDPPESYLPPAVQTAVRFFFKLVTLVILSILTLPFWPLYGLGTRIWYRPPNVPRAAQVRRYLRLTWSVDPPPPGLWLLARCWLTSFWVLAWLLDELLYGRAIDATPLLLPGRGRASAARSHEPRAEGTHPVQGEPVPGRTRD